jgi:hypothetical protein
MLTYKELKKNKAQFLSVTGMELLFFDRLHEVYRKEWDGYIAEYTVSGEKRQRPHQKRKDGVLEDTADQLLFLLHYLKSNNIQDHHAAIYGMRQAQCNLWLHLLLKLVRRALARLGHLPERDAGKLKKVLSGYKEIYIDGTERDIQRPLDDAQQRKHYSGKKNA